MIRIEPLPDDVIVVEEVAEMTLPLATMEAVDAAWAQARGRRPSLRDDPLLSLQSQDGATLRGHFVPYRFWIAQRADPSLTDVLHVRPLAVTGLTRVEEGWLLGKRADDTTQDPGRWELVPAGGFSLQARVPPHRLSPTVQLGLELEEELNLDPARIEGAVPRFLVEDAKDGVWDLVYELMLDVSLAEVQRAFDTRDSREVVELACVAPEDVAEYLDRMGPHVAPVSRAILSTLIA